MTGFKIRILVFCVFLALATNGRAAGFDTINVTRQLHSWWDAFNGKVAGLKAGGSGYFDCRETEEIHEAYLCQFPDMREMNGAMLRATMFVEGTAGHQIGTVAGWSDPDLFQAFSTIAGHDLTGENLKRFYDRASQECLKDRLKCMIPEEKAFFAKFLPEINRTGGKLVVIAFPAISPVTPFEIVSHEILHAQYFLQPAYTRAVDKFWSDALPETDKLTVKQLLAATYNVNDDMLVRNEFQAYILMNGANTSMLSPLVLPYRDRFMKDMEEAGAHPIQVGW